VVGIAALVAIAAVVAALGGDRPLFEDQSRRDLARLAVLLPLVFSAVVTVPTNLSTVGDTSSPGSETIEVRDYSVTYAEDVENGMVSAVNVSLFGETTSVKTSGVIVISEKRHVWTNEIRTARLRFAGRNAVRVGGIGWRERVVADRRGWSAAGGGAAYKIFLRRGGTDDWRLAYTSERAVAGPRLRNRSVAVTPTEDGFAVELLANESAVTSAPVPAPGEAVNLSSITVENDGNTLFASYNGTRVAVGGKETYN
jgi:hypothetical protein